MSIYWLSNTSTTNNCSETATSANNERTHTTTTTTTTTTSVQRPISRTTWVSQHQKGKPFWILLELEMLGWQWHQLDHMQIICTSLQTNSHASTLPLRFFTGRMPLLPPDQQRQSTEGKNVRTYAV